jgi:putative transposase
LLVALKSSHCLADVMRELKKASSAGVHEEIGQRSLRMAQRYISNQEEHHRLKPVREEVVELLEKARVEYDPRYLD